MKTDKIKGLRIYTETIGTLTYIKCETEKGDTIAFPHTIKPVREVFAKVVEIMSEISWDGVDTSNISEEHYQVYKKARFETSKI
jgi:hypothetical protein